MRLTSLDSLRGLAAFTVVLHHVVLTTSAGGPETMPWLHRAPLGILIAGPAAVLIFFVLSGLVLALGFLGPKSPAYLPFVVKRITRIWPAFAVAILISAVLCAVIGRGPVAGTTSWFMAIWLEGSGWRVLAHHLFMTDRTTSLDNPIWSLIYEMRIALIFPLLILATKWNWRIALAGSVLLFFACVWLVGERDLPRMAVSAIMTVAYIHLFVVGIILALHLATIRARLSALPAWAHLGLWALALSGVMLVPDRADRIEGLSDGCRLLIGGAAATLIVGLCAAEGRVFRALAGRIPAYLGRISYSLYLIHVVVIAAIVHATAAQLPLWLALALSIAVSIVVADLLERFCEQPTTDAGRRLAKRVERWRSRASGIG